MILTYKPHMLPKVRSDKIMGSAAGMPCTARIASFIPGYRCSGPETTVAAHFPVGGKGISSKVTDLAVGYVCHTCHRILDQPSSKEREYLAKHYGAAVLERLLCGLVETHSIMVAEGIIEIPGAQIIDCGNWR